MPRYVALLRGINVGGRRVIRMTDLRGITESIGGRDVATYIQSGNVVFAHPARSSSALATKLAQAILKSTSLDVPVIVRSAAELANTIADNPFAAENPDHLYVLFVPAKPPANLFATLDLAKLAPERCAARRDVYLLLPGGFGRSKLVATLGRLPPLAEATARNWRTVQKLVDLAA